MTTREERKKLVDEEFTFLAISDAYSLIDKIYDDFESQLSSNPLQLTCEGCPYSICDATTYAECASACYKCTRQPYRIDMHPFRFKKDTK
jgi:hypothetical protein